MWRCDSAAMGATSVTGCWLVHHLFERDLNFGLRIRVSANGGSVIVIVNVTILLACCYLLVTV